MKVVCNKTQLVDAINTAQKAVSGKSNVQILEGLFLEAQKNKLKLVGNDLEIGIECTFDCEVVEEGSIVLNSRVFGEIVRKLPEDNVSIVCDDENNVLIKSKNSRFNIKGLKAIDFPQLPNIEAKNVFQISQELLKNMIRQTNFAVSTDENKQILTGSLFEVEENEISIVSVDGYRLAQRKARVLSGDKLSAVIPGKTLNEINKILAQDETLVSISINNNQIMFQMNDCKVVSRLLEGKFLNYKEIIPKEFETKATVNTKELLDSVERASLISREDKKYPVKFLLKDEKINISSAAEIGNVQEEIDAKIEGKDLEIGFNPKYFIDALRAVEYETITLNFTTSYGPCVIDSPQQEDFVYLILPVRLK